ncbi:MAG: iron-sulfur cluster biosynthesis protein [Lactobacillus sp.]|nr:MAG: iron-sulfur cluster biosynthesis protein [Lactobacillus sp.]
MQISVTDRASQWFQDEMGLQRGMGVRFFGKVYGKTPVHDGFSIGMSRDDHPIDPIVDTEKDGIHYFVAELDEWFFKGFDLTVEYDPKTDGPIYEYQQNNELE